MQKGGRKNIPYIQILVITENNACFVPTSSPAGRGSTIYVLNFFAEHCARATHSMALCDIKTRWHCLFCDQGDRSKGREKESSSYPRRWDFMILCLTNMQRDICLCIGRIHVYNSAYHRWCTNLSLSVNNVSLKSFITRINLNVVSSEGF